MNESTTEAASVFAPLWKRKWLILAVALIVAAATYEYYHRKHATFTANTSIYLGGAAENGTPGASGGKTTLTGRALADQVELINTTVALQLHRQLRAEHKLTVATAKGKAAAAANSDFITISAEARKRKAAVAYANALAAAYIARQRHDYTRKLQNEIATARSQLRRIETPVSGKGGKPGGVSVSATIQEANLESKISGLETALSSFSGAQQVGPAKAHATAGAGSAKSNAVFGFVLGLILGGVVAYLLGRLDRRIRELPVVETIFGAPIIAALPSVRSPLLRRDGTRAPAPGLVEPLRRLHTTLKLSHRLGGERAPRALLFISPEAGDGRSTIVASLAQVQRDAGERVVVVEGDFRRPVMGRLLGVEGARGLVDVLEGRASVEAAMQRVQGAVSAPSPAQGIDGGGVATVVGASVPGSLSALVSGGPATNPPALLGSEAMAELVRGLADENDYVLIDAPPPLEVSDVLPLMSIVDAIVVVVRVGHTRDSAAERAAQLLGRTATAPVIGVVANCVPKKDIERHGFGVGGAGRRRGLLSR